MTKLIFAALATVAFAIPAHADGQYNGGQHTGGKHVGGKRDVAASSYLAERPDSADRGESRQTARRVIIRDPNLRQVTPDGDPDYRNLATNPAR